MKVHSRGFYFKGTNIGFFFLSLEEKHKRFHGN